jgi:chromosome partitioning protein
MNTKWLVIASPKGGTGKTTLARNLAVAAALEGLRVCVVDLDRQRTLTKWIRRRNEELGELVKLRHHEASIEEAGAIVATISAADIDLVVVDTPPSIEDHPDSIRILLLGANLILVPSRPTIDDADSVASMARLARGLGKTSAFVLNAVKPRLATLEIKAALAGVGELCPFEIGDRTDHHKAARHGMALAEVTKHPGGEEIRAVWLYAKSKLWGWDEQDGEITEIQSEANCS